LRRLRPQAEINVTPLVDVMLVLLVIFMITAPMMQSGVSVELPKADAPALPQKEEPVEVFVLRDGGVRIGKRALSARALEGVLRGILQRRPEAQIFVRADRRTPYEAVARALAAIERAGARHVALVTIPERR